MSISVDRIREIKKQNLELKQIIKNQEERIKELTAAYAKLRALSEGLITK